MRSDRRYCFSSSSTLILLVTFFESFYVTVAESCTYSSFGSVRQYSCLSSEYCCGHGSCCLRNDYYYGVYDLWYFWFCICFGIFICSLAGGTYYRKRQLHTVRVSAIPAGHQGGLVVGVHGPCVRGAQLTRHAPPPRDVFVAATSTSGQPMYPIGMYDVPPNYPVYSTGLGGPMYPAYACNMPPPAYNTLNTGYGEATNAASGTLGATTTPPATGGKDTASYPEVGPSVSS